MKLIAVTTPLVFTTATAVGLGAALAGGEMVTIGGFTTE